MSEEGKNVKTLMAQRFRGYLPVVVDIETGGFDPQKNPLLETAAVLIDTDENGVLSPFKCHSHHVEPFENCVLDQAALDFTGIIPDHPFRFAVKEETALVKTFQTIRKELKRHRCQRAILVGHNPGFDLSFINAAVKRCGLKRNPFHPFVTFDTATLGGLAFGQTVLARACDAGNIPFDRNEAHSAIYDAKRTAELFCKIVNKWQDLGGWPLA